MGNQSAKPEVSWTSSSPAESHGEEGQERPCQQRRVMRAKYHKRRGIRKLSPDCCHRIAPNSHRNPLAVVFGSGSKLGSRAAFLNFSVVDASTGSVVKNATITLRRAANLDDFLSTRKTGDDYLHIHSS